MNRQIDAVITTGAIHLSVQEKPEWPVERLVDFAARANPKRGFLFVSKVLGKHIPVELNEQLVSHQALAEQINTDLPGPILFISLAETGTGLGHGVFESFRKISNRSDLLFWHSSRYKTAEDELLLFEESHSHAPSQWMCLPKKSEYRKLIEQSKTVILIDDEISTGNTFFNLYKSLCAINHTITNLVLGALTDFSGKSNSDWSSKMGIPTQCISLLSGSFSFEPSGFMPNAVSKPFASGEIDVLKLADSWGRYGLDSTHIFSEQYCNTILQITKNAQTILLLGSGEFLFASTHLALTLQNLGKTVFLQSTTRSPILEGGAIFSRLQVPDAYGEQVDHYIYNFSPQKYDITIILHEPNPSQEFHDFFEQQSVITIGIELANSYIHRS